MKKILSLMALASITTFVLFAFMAFLIDSDQVKISDPLPDVFVEVYQLPEDSKAKEISRKLIPPPMPQPPMPREVMTPDADDTGNDFHYSPIGIKMTSQSSTLGDISKPTDREARPVVRIPPEYPMGAARDGIEGWVILGFDISAIGEVINIKVVESEPKRIFDKAAKKALRKWKYRAKSKNGRALIQKGFTVQLDFKMNQQI